MSDSLKKQTVSRETIEGGLFVCSACGGAHSRFRGRHSAVPASYCERCHAAYMRRTRPRHRDLNPFAKKKANARRYALVYVKRGLLDREPCERCGALDVEMHHDDYDRPIVVHWLCRPCRLAHLRDGS